MTHSKLNTLNFLPMHTVRVVERTSSVVQQKNGVTTRVLTEIILVEVNQTLIVELMRENEQLKRQLEGNSNQFGDIYGFFAFFAGLLGLLFKLYEHLGNNIS